MLNSNNSYFKIAGIVSTLVIICNILFRPEINNLQSVYSIERSLQDLAVIYQPQGPQDGFLGETKPTPSPENFHQPMSNVTPSSSFSYNEVEFPTELYSSKFNDKSLKLTNVHSIPSTILEWNEYSDEFWKFTINIPEGWEVNNQPYIGLGFNISSQGLELNAIGNPIRGSYILIDVRYTAEFDIDKYLQGDHYFSKIISVEATEENGLPVFQIDGISEGGIRFFEKIIISRDYYYKFQALVSENSISSLNLIKVIYSSIQITGIPMVYPKTEESKFERQSFSFTPIKLPFSFGYGKIISGYGHQNPPNQYAFDLCEGQNCSASILDQYVISPTKMKYDWSLDADGNGTLDFHFFEIAKDDVNQLKLCTQMGHFKLEISGLVQGTEIPAGAALGRINEYYPSIEHIHMGLYTIPSNLRCAGDPTQRIGIPFVNPYTLDGVSYATGQTHQGKSVTSNNYPFCWMPTNGQAGPKKFLNNDTNDAGCFPDNDTIPPTGYFTNPANGSTITSNTVTISVNASDNSGGSGVKEVRFSAVWPGGQWTGIGTDSSYPYSIEWNMCNNNVPDGDIELGMEILDNEGNKYVNSEHATNPHINKAYACIGGDPIGGDGIWNLDAWMNKYLAGYVNWSGTITWSNYPYIYWDFGSGAPFSDWSGNEFSMRFSRDVYFPGGNYDFRAFSDDGVRVYVDNQILIDTWWDHRGESGSSRYVSPGYHNIKVEYYENQGDAVIHVFWYGLGYPRPDIDPPTGQIKAPTHLSAINDTPLFIYADASDDASGVNRVEFYAWYCTDSCDWRLLSVDNSAPYSCDWDWSFLGPRHIWLDILVYDNDGKVSSNSAGWVEVDFDNINPFGQITHPFEGFWSAEKIVEVEVNAHDDQTGISSVQFFAGYEGYGDYWHEIGWDTNESDGWRFIWDGNLLPDGTEVAFYTYIYDRAGNYYGDVIWNTRIGMKALYIPIIKR